VTQAVRHERGRSVTAPLDPESNRPSFVRVVSETFAARIIGIAVGVVTLTLTTRLLGPEGRGQFAVVMATLALVLQFANFGLPSSATYFLSRDPSRRTEIVGVLFWFSLFVVSAISCVAFLMAVRAPGLFQSVPRGWLGLALLSAPPAMFVLLAGNAFLGIGRPRLFNALDLAAKFIGLVAVLLLVRYPMQAFLAAYGTLHYALAVSAYERLLGWHAPRIPSKAAVRGLIGYGARAYLATLFMFVVLRIDLFLVTAIRGIADAGQYSVAVQVAEILNIAAASIAAMAFPRLTALPAGERLAAARRVAAATGVVLGFGVIAVGFSARVIFPRWFGPQFTPAVTALWWLLPGLWCLGVNSVLYQHLAASGMPWFMVIAVAFAAALNVAVNLLVIPRWGILGSAFASTVAYATLLMMTVVYLRSNRSRRDLVAV
jgi:O-antigen/teichoic acid export membrane protein